VKAHLLLGRLDGAEEALRPVLSTAPEHRVRPLLFLMDEVRAMVSVPPVASEPIVRTIHDAILDFRRHTAVRELN
jgi:hypothetical protein